MINLRQLLSARLLCALLLASAATAQAVPQGVTDITSVEGVTEYRLHNGLRILLAPDNARPVVTVNMVYLVGSRDEGAGEGGMAHLLEHLVFKGSPTTPDPKAQFGQRAMQWNGTTSFDRTNYFATFAPEDDNLDWYLGWLADSMVNSFIAQRDLDSEMTVVRNEFERAGVRPDVMLFQGILAAAYQWHPYGRAVIGTLSDIEHVSIARLQAFYRRFYQPDNAVLLVAGKFDADAALSRIAAVFGSIPKPQRALEPGYTQEPVQQGERSVIIRRTGNTPLVAVAYHAVPGGGKDYAAQAVLRQILTGVPSGRLHKALVQAGLASGVSDWSQQTRDPGFLFFSALLADGANADRAQQALIDTLEAMPPVTEEEVGRAKTFLLNAINRSLRDAQSLAMGVTDAIAVGDWRLRFAMRDWIADVTIEDVNRIARNYLVRSNRTDGRYIPTDRPLRAPSTQRADTDALLKDYRGRVAITQVEDFPMTNLDIGTRTVQTALPGGMKLALLARATKAERVTGILRLRWGTLEALQGRRADALLLAHMMLKGTGDLSRADFNNTLSDLDSTISVSGITPGTGGLAGLSIEFSAPKANLPRVLRLLAAALQRPVFPTEEFEQERRAFIAQNMAIRNDPASFASVTLTHHLVRYPADDARSAYLPQETLKAARAATAERMVDFYREFAGASNAELAMIGPIDSDAVTAQVRELFDGWRSPQPYARISRPFQDIGAERFVLDMPDKTNAAYVGIVPLPLEDSDADTPALQVAVQLLGGRAGTRLWNRLREKEGLSYGVQASMNVATRERNGRISISGSFAPQNRDRFEAALRDELDKVLRDGFSALEVDFAKETILRSRRQYLAQEQAVAYLLADNLYQGRDMNWRDQRDRDYAALTPAQVNAALKKYLDPGRLSAAVAGDFAGK